MLRSSHRTLLDTLGQETKPFTRKAYMENECILAAHKIEEDMGCIFLNNDLSGYQVQSFIATLKKHLEQHHIAARPSSPTGTNNVVIELHGKNPARAWHYITTFLLGLPTNKIKDVSAPAFAPIILDNPKNGRDTPIKQEQKTTLEYLEYELLGLNGLNNIKMEYEDTANGSQTTYVSLSSPESEDEFLASLLRL